MNQEGRTAYEACLRSVRDIEKFNQPTDTWHKAIIYAEEYIRDLEETIDILEDELECLRRGDEM